MNWFKDRQRVGLNFRRVCSVALMLSGAGATAADDIEPRAMTG
jgi:hypothetical protein